MDELYVAARRALLDALDGLGPVRDGVILVGAQAIYLHTGPGELAVAPFTTDADLAIDPAQLGTDPKLEAVLTDAGFARVPDHVVGICFDRVAVNTHEKQRFGTQGRCKEEGGGWEPRPMEDPDKVDQRRAAIGLKPMEDYIARFEEMCP